MTTSVTQPTIIRCNIVPLKSEPNDSNAAGAADALATTGAGNGSPPRAATTSGSMRRRVASASSGRPTEAGQRGDSGSDLRPGQTPSAPLPPRPNTPRPPNARTKTG